METKTKQERRNELRAKRLKARARRKETRRMKAIRRRIQMAKSITALVVAFAVVFSGLTFLTNNHTLPTEAEVITRAQEFNYGTEPQPINASDAKEALMVQQRKAKEKAKAEAIAKQKAAEEAAKKEAEAKAAEEARIAEEQRIAAEQQAIQQQEETQIQENTQPVQQTEQTPAEQPAAPVNNRTDGFNYNGHHYDTPTFYGSGLVPAWTNNAYYWGNSSEYGGEHYLFEKSSDAGQTVWELGVGSQVVVNGRTLTVRGVQSGIQRTDTDFLLNLASQGYVTWQTCDTYESNSTLTFWWAS